MENILIAVAGGVLGSAAVVILARILDQVVSGVIRRRKRNHGPEGCGEEIFEDDVPLWR
jgi:hypothetical protein